MTKLLTLTWPSGVWKTTIAKALVEKYSNLFDHAIAFTTRTPREREIDGVDYYFKSRDEVEALENAWELLRISNIHWNLYGHTKDEIERISKNWRIGIVIPDLYWLKIYKQHQRNDFQVKAWLILPESKIVLWRRLKDRMLEWRFTDDTRERWKKWWEEFVIQGQKEGVYDFEVINHTDNVQWTIAEIIRMLQWTHFL